MFFKQYKIKTQTIIKGSDRKKLRAQVNNQFPDISQQTLIELVPNKEEMTVSKIQLHNDDVAIIYTLLKNPIFFELKAQLYPTVYTLWKSPDLLPSLTTHPQVFSKIANGADLMLPGVITNGPVLPHTFKHLNKGDMCIMKLLGNKSPVAIGHMLMSGEDMYLSAMRGKGMSVVHCYKDFLWAAGDKSDPPLVPDPSMMAENESEDEQESENQDPTEHGEQDPEPDAGKKDESEERLVENVSEEKQKEEEVDEDDEGNAAEEPSAADDTQEKPSSAESHEASQLLSDTKDRMDQLLFDCFLCALKLSIKKKDLPLLTSNFYKLHMLPYCPANEKLDVKKSSYKKLSKFLQTMKEKEFLQVKEFPKGVENIVEVDFSHPELRAFDATAFSKKEPSAEAVDTARSDSYQLPIVTEIYLVTAPTLLFFNMFGHNKGSALTKPQIKAKIAEYVKLNKLQRLEATQQVVLDETLTTVLQCGKHDSSEALQWDEILTRLMSKMSPAYQISRPGENPVIKKGKLESVTLTIAQRASNKKVTFVQNLDLYGIDPAEFAHQVQVGCACSTSVSEEPGKGLVVMVQGNQVNFISNLLFDKYKLPKKSLQGCELAPKPKKKR